MEAAIFLGKFVRICQITQRHMPQDSNLYLLLPLSVISYFNVEYMDTKFDGYHLKSLQIRYICYIAYIIFPSL